MNALRQVCRYAVATFTVAACVLAHAGVSAYATPPVIAPAPVPYTVTSFGEPLSGPAVGIGVDPAIPDGYFGWYVSVARVTLKPERTALVRFAWDDPAGAWLPYAGPVIVPEGRHVLYAQADDGSSRGPLAAIEVKFDTRSQPIKLRTLAPSAESGPEGRVALQATVNPWAGPRVVRVFGENRYETSAEIATTDFQTAPTAIVARGDNFPDALAAAGLAGIYNAPIVLSLPTEVPSEVTDALAKLGTKHAIVVGDTRAVSVAVETQLRRAGFSVERIGGIDRYETAALIGQAIVERGGEQGKAFVTRGDIYPDSLAVSPYAFRAKRPIILVRPTSIPDVSARALTSLGIRGTVIAGSDKAVSNEVADQVAGLTGSIPIRAEGIDRYATAIQAARYGVASGLGDYHLVGLATGQNFPDALCGGAAVGAQGGVILMTPKNDLYKDVASELVSNGPTLRDIQVYGSEAAVSKTVWDSLISTIR